MKTGTDWKKNGPYICKVCGKELETQQALGGHMNAHKGDSTLTTLGRVEKAETLIRKANEEMNFLRAENAKLKERLDGVIRELETAKMGKALERMEEAETQLRKNMVQDRAVKQATHHLPPVEPKKKRPWGRRGKKP